ncbi:hypothetical protein [Ornithinimicrobium cerasi]|uniref:hypothetical protein n=1 Tax=Ornithinimicrobium cerasi TaxID=2248773 RepID=UPI00137B0843|nr:hypothetical protein [Ornithinimicrobium cerasi]
MVELPKAQDPHFAERMREILKSGTVDTHQLQEILNDKRQDYDLRFASLYGLLQELHREEKERQYSDLVNRYFEEFHTEPYYHTFLAVVAAGDGTSESGLRGALGHSRKAIVSFPDTPGVLHQYAALSASIGELAGSVDRGESERALDVVERAIALSTRTNPNFHRTRARLLRQLGRLDEALLEINTAIRLQDASTPSEVRQLTQFEAFRSILYFDKSSAALEARIEEAKRDLNAAKSEQVQLLGVLAAVIALITSAVTISTRMEADAAFRFIVVAVGAITMAFSSLMWAGGASRWQRIIPGFVVGALLIACGLMFRLQLP